MMAAVGGDEVATAAALLDNDDLELDHDVELQDITLAGRLYHLERATGNLYSDWKTDEDGAPAFCGRLLPDGTVDEEAEEEEPEESLVELVEKNIGGQSYLASMDSGRVYSATATDAEGYPEYAGFTDPKILGSAVCWLSGTVDENVREHAFR